MLKRYTLLLACLLSACSENIPGPVNCGLPKDQQGGFVVLPAGQFPMGAGPIYREEAPTTTVHVERFALQAHEVTNDQFAAFAAATGYVTDAERSAAAGGVGAGSAVFFLPNGKDGGKEGVWRLVSGATWRTPLGPGSSIGGKGRHPVVHVSQNDAAAYAAWAGGRLPTEVEWEYAAHLSLPDPDNQTSGAYDADGRPTANTWQGIFPVINTAEDGFLGSAPVGCFGADQQGFYDLFGNVWEWTDSPYAPGLKTIKGGSFLCSHDYCRRYRPAAKQPQEINFSSNHIGFRIVRDLPAPQD